MTYFRGIPLILMAGLFLFGAWNQNGPTRPPGKAPISGSTPVFSDDFDSDPEDRWQVLVRGGSSGSGGIEHTLRHETTGGNPGGFRAMTHRIDGEGSLFVTYVYTAAFYVPSEQGAITSINYSEDRLSLDGRPVGSRAVILQGGVVHAALLSTFREQIWTRETVHGLNSTLSMCEKGTGEIERIKQVGLEFFDVYPETATLKKAKVLQLR